MNEVQWQLLLDIIEGKQVSGFATGFIIVALPFPLAVIAKKTAKNPT